MDFSKLAAEIYRINKLLTVSPSHFAFPVHRYGPTNTLPFLYVDSERSLDGKLPPWKQRQEDLNARSYNAPPSLPTTSDSDEMYVCLSAVRQAFPSVAFVQ